MNNLYPNWFQVEKAIQKEITWLKDNIYPYQADKNLLNYSDDLFYRLIAILIISGKIKAVEYKYSYDYNKVIKKYSTDKKHGKDWHNSMINYLAELFTSQNYKIDKNEPVLYYGHADLKIEKDRHIVYLEIDTINIFKLYINLMLMNNINLIIINNEKVIKFRL